MDPRQRLLGHLTGISDRALDQHVSVMEGQQRELVVIDAAYPRVSSAVPPAAASLPPGEVQRLLDTPIAALPLSLETGQLGDALARLKAEVNAKGLTFWPGFYLGDDDFWTTDRATSVNIPWYLGSDATWLLVNDRRLKLSEDDVLRILRHEYGHALLYAYRGWEAPGWREAFGDFDAPYLDAYVPDPARAGDFVQNLGRPGPGQMAHYPQKHADEDWAETFATWLAGGWEDVYLAGVGVESYPTGSRASVKLNFVGRLVVGQGAFYGAPKVTAPGRRSPYQQLPGTVGDYLGVQASYSEHAALLRRDAPLRAEAALHALYFDNLGPSDPGPGPALLAQASAAYGTWEGFLAEVRAVGGTAEGWALVVWDQAGQRVRCAAVDAAGAGVPPGCPVLLALCCREHSWALDYGVTGRHLGLAAALRNVDWGAAEARLVAALPPPTWAQATQVALDGLVTLAAPVVVPAPSPATPGVTEPSDPFDPNS